MAVTFVGHASLRGEELGDERIARTSWQTSTEVREALASASEPSPASTEPARAGAPWIPLSDLERASRAIYW